VQQLLTASGEAERVRKRTWDMPSVTLRRASDADAQILFDWRNDPDTRRNSRHSEAVGWDDHRRWLSAALARSDRTLLIAELAGEPVGTVRLDRGAEGCELSWTVAPRWRGRGVGRTMVQKAAEESGAAVLLAAVREGNLSSARIAEGCGFIRSGEQDGFILYRRGTP